MTAGPPSASTTTPFWRRVWDRLSVTHLAWALAAVVLGVSAIFGGLDRADHVESAALNEPYDNGPFVVTPKRVTVIDYLPKLPELPPQCRFLVLDTAIESLADESVLVQSGGGMGLEPGCEPASSRGSIAFDIATPPGVFVGVYRGHVEREIQAIGPGLEYDYTVVWAVPLAALQRDPNVVIRIYDMASYVSAFRVARDWGRTNTVKYAELRTSVGSVS